MRLRLNDIVALMYGQFAGLPLARLGKEFFWIVVGQVAVVLGALVGVRLLTTVMPPDSYGELALGMTVATFVQLFVFGPLNNGATRFYAQACEVGTLSSYISAVRRIVMRSTTVLVFVGGLVGCILVALGQSRWIGLGSAALFFALISGYNSVFNGIQSAARQRNVVALHQGIASWGRFLVAWGLLWWLGSSSSMAMLGYGLAMMVVFISQCFFFRRTVSVNGGRLPSIHATAMQWERDIFRYSWPFVTWAGLAWLNLVSDRWAIKMFSSMYDVGLYAVIFQFGYYPISLLGSMGTQFLAPVYFQRAGDATDSVRMLEVYELGSHVTLVVLMGALVLIGILAVFHKPIFSLLVASGYRDVSYLLPWMALASGFMVTSQYCAIVLQAHQLTRRLVVPRNISYGIGVALVVLGAALFGLEGVIGGKVVGEFVHMLWIGSIVKNEHKDLKFIMAESKCH